MSFFSSKPSRNGFTLIELLVVISIIGLLSSVVLASLSQSRTKSYDARRLEDMRTLKTAMDIFYLDHQRYPCGQILFLSPAPYRAWAWSYDGFSHMTSNSGGYCPNNPVITLVSEGIIDTMPKDPIGDDKHQYIYEVLNTYDGKPQKYIIYNRLDSGTMSANDGGLCSKLYEVGSGVGTIRPSNVIINGLMDMPCN